ncbi:MAG: PKD domain-containing protein [Chitinophagaceae bacterium]
MPTVNFTTSLPGCAGQDVTFTDASLPNAGSIVKWSWNYGDGNTAVLTNGNPFTHNYATVNSYPVTLQVETNKGCVSSISPQTIIINAVPIAAFIPPNVCVSDNFPLFTDASSVVGGSITAWQWNFGDAANSTAGNPNTSAAQNPTHHYSLRWIILHN